MKIAHLTTRMLIGQIVVFDNVNFFTDEMCKNITKSGFISNVASIEYALLPGGLVQRDMNGNVDKQIKTGLSHKGLLIDQENVEKNCIYKACYNNKYIDVICITSGSWNRGTDIPDVKFKPFDYKNIRR